MKRLTLILCLTCAAPAMAQEDGPSEGLSLMERGAQMLMEGLLEQMEPALDDLQGLAQEFGPALQDFASQMGPALRDLLDEVEDWSAYHPPEVLENGDIIIRRKPEVAPAPAPRDQIDI
ncbi:MAG: hypothetical protein AAFQ19_15670 [Pseudomonadota bacterium]